jgi:hypothetical protein
MRGADFGPTNGRNDLTPPRGVALICGRKDRRAGAMLEMGTTPQQINPGSDTLPTASKQITCVGYTCPNCNQRVAVLRSSTPPLDFVGHFMQSICRCGRDRQISEEEIPSLDIWTEFPPGHLAGVLRFRSGD